MADNKPDSASLDPGFDEVPLDEGFDEIPIETNQQSSNEDKLAQLRADLAKSQVMPEMSEAKQAGLITGLTMNASPKLGAIKDVAGDVISGNQGFDGLGSKWQQYRAAREEANRSLQESNPSDYLIGQIGGTALSTPLLPGFGAAKLISRASKLAPGAKAFLAGKTGSALANIGGRATADAIKGAPIGGVMGLAGTEATDIPGVAKDVLSGIGMGSLTGMAIGGAAQGIKEGAKAVKNIGKDSDFIQKMKALYGMGKQGVNVSGSSGQDTTALLAAKTVPNEITNQIMKVDKLNGQEIGKTIQNAQQSGLSFNIDEGFSNARIDVGNFFAENPLLPKLVNKESYGIFSGLSNKGNLTPVEAQELMKSLYTMADDLEGPAASDAVSLAAKKQAYELANQLNSALKEQIPGYKQAAEKFARFRQEIPETILQPGTPTDKRTVYLGDLNNKQTKLFEATRDMFEQAQLPGASVTAGGRRAGLVELGQNLESLQMTDPDIISKLGGKNAGEIYQGWKDKANLLAGLKQAQGFNPHQGFVKTLVGHIVGSGEGLALNISNKLGRASKAIGESGPVRMSDQLFSADNGKLMQLAQSLKGTTGTGRLGEALEKALQNKSDIAKKAVLFQLMQDPNYREHLRQQGFVEETE